MFQLAFRVCPCAEADVTFLKWPLGTGKWLPAALHSSGLQGQIGAFGIKKKNPSGALVILYTRFLCFSFTSTK